MLNFQIILLSHLMSNFRIILLSHLMSTDVNVPTTLLSHLMSTDVKGSYYTVVTLDVNRC